MSKNSKGFIIRCECGDIREHAIHVHQWNTGHASDDSEIGHCSINLAMEIRKPWYKRIWTALKYAFGYTDHMHFIDTIVDVQVLKDVVAQLEDNRTDAQKAGSREQRTWTEYEIK